MGPEIGVRPADRKREKCQRSEASKKTSLSSMRYALCLFGAMRFAIR